MGVQGAQVARGAHRAGDAVKTNDDPMPPVDVDDSLARFLRPAAERSASPEPDREPEKRGAPPTPDPEPTKAARIDLGSFASEAVETWRKLEQIPEERAGVLHPGFLRRPAKDSPYLHGARHWSWCYGKQPVFVPGSVYEGSDEARHLVRGITEDQAQRNYLTAEARAHATGEGVAALVAGLPSRHRRMLKGRR